MHWKQTKTCLEIIIDTNLKYLKQKQKQLQMSFKGK